jgi:hypothetical protein
MSAEPWGKFFWSDYDADEGLRMCSLASQGLWMRMLCIMARADPKGELRVGGEPCSDADLARSVGESEELVRQLLDELFRRGVYSITRSGVVFCRRMRKDAELSRKRSIAGAHGAALRYGKQKENDGCHSKVIAKALANRSPQNPESRIQKEGGSRARVAGTPIHEEWRPERFVQTTRCARIVAEWSKDRYDRETERFIAYHQSQGTCFDNWQAAWKGWVLKSEDFDAEPSWTGRPQQKSSSYVDVVLAELDRKADIG